MWEPAADYNNYYDDDDIARDSMKNSDMKHSQPLQTIGDILYDQGELNPRTYAEYSHSNHNRAPTKDYVPGQLYPDGEHHEEDAEGNPKTFKRVLVRFAERTSMQGVPYIYVSSVWYAKLGWSFLFFAGFCLMVGHLYLLFDEFYEYDTHSTVTLGFSTLVFPAVTICNVNPIKQSKMYMATPELRLLVDAVQPTNIAGSMEEERNKKNAPADGNAAVQLPASDGGSTGDMHTGGTQQSSAGTENQQSTSGQQNEQSLTGTEDQQSSPGQQNEQSSTGTEDQKSSSGQQNEQSSTGTEDQKSSSGQQNEQSSITESTQPDETVRPITPSSASTITTTTAFVGDPGVTITSEPKNASSSDSQQQSTTPFTTTTSVATTSSQERSNEDNPGKPQTQMSTEPPVTHLHETAPSTVSTTTQSSQQTSTNSPVATDTTHNIDSNIPEVPEITTLSSTLSTTPSETTTARQKATIVNQASGTTAASSSVDESTSASTSTSPFDTPRIVTNSNTATTTTAIIENKSSTGTIQEVTTVAQQNQNVPTNNRNEDSSDTSSSTNQKAASNQQSGTTRKRRSLNDIHEEKVKKRYKRFIDGFSIEESNTRMVDDEDGGPSGNKSAIRAIEDEFRFLFSTMGRDARYQMGHSIDKMLMECTFRGISCDSSQFRLVQTAQFGNCYTIENNRYISTVGGPDDGLTMYLFMEDNEYLHGITNSMGFQVHIHNIGEMPNPYSEGLSVSAGMETFIGLKKVNIDRQKHPYGECIENESFKSLYNITYTQRTCQAFCLQKTVIEECDCFDAENDEIFKSLADAQVVLQPDGNSSARYNPCRTIEESECYRLQVRRFQEQEFSCDCPSPCQESLYTKALSSKIWPTEEYAGILVEYLCAQNETTCDSYKQKSRSEIATSFLKMVIYYEDLNYENITEEVDYETFQFLSDVGGTIGLWIGLSMISFFEVLQFLYEIAHYFIYMKPKLARERARKEKLRRAKHNVTHALKFINSSGMTPMSSAASKLMTSDPAGSRSSSQGSRPKRVSKPKEGTGSAGDSGTGGDSLSSDRAPRNHHLPQGQHRHAHRNAGHPWHSEAPGVGNYGFREDLMPGLRDMSMMSSPAAYMPAPYRNPGVDTRDVDVNFDHYKHH